MMSSIVYQLCFKSVASILYFLRQHDSILLSGLSKHLAHSHHRWQYHHFLRLKSSSGWQAECSAAHQPFFYSSHKAALLQSWSAAKLILYRDDIHWRSIMSTHLLSHIFKKLIFKFLFCPCHRQDGIQVHTARADNREAAGKMFLLSLQK